MVRPQIVITKKLAHVNLAVGHYCGKGKGLPYVYYVKKNFGGF